MLYQLSYEALLEIGQVWVQFIPVIWREWRDAYVITIKSVLRNLKNTSESDPRSYEVKQLQIKPRKNSEAPTGFGLLKVLGWIMRGIYLYQVSDCYEVSSG